MPTIQLQVPQLIMRTITKHYTVNNIRQNKTIYNGPTEQFAYWFYTFLAPQEIESGRLRPNIDNIRLEIRGNFHEPLFIPGQTNTFRHIDVTFLSGSYDSGVRHLYVGEDGYIYEQHLGQKKSKKRSKQSKKRSKQSKKRSKQSKKRSKKRSNKKLK